MEKMKRRTNNKKGQQGKRSSPFVLQPPDCGCVSSGCYHGSTADAFDPRSEYRNVLEAYGKVFEDASRMGACPNSIGQFFKTHDRVLLEPGFARFVFALALEDYLQHVRN